MYYLNSSNSMDYYLKEISSKGNALYYTLLLLLIGGMVSLPVLKFDISVKTTGISRPILERTELKSMISGIIDTVFCREGQLVNEGSVIIRLRDNNSMFKTILNDYELSNRRQFIHDLGILTSTPYLTADNITNLQSPVYKQQIGRFIYQQEEQKASLKKVKKELQMDSILSIDRVISPKEMFDKIVENEKLQAAYQAFKNEQISIWQQDLLKNRLELSQLEAQRKQIDEEKRLYELKSPVTGVLQDINTKYAGNIIQAGETLCIISPETGLIAECYVPTHDIGLLKSKQAAKFQIDAFDYKYFGIITGEILSIGNDFTLIENKPFFKVRCSFDSIQLHLKNGYTGQLKKGLTLQASFRVAKRSLWQLLFDKLDDWLNPISQNKN